MYADCSHPREIQFIAACHFAEPDLQYDLLVHHVQTFQHTDKRQILFMRRLILQV